MNLRNLKNLNNLRNLKNDDVQEHLCVTREWQKMEYTDNTLLKQAIIDLTVWN